MKLELFGMARHVVGAGVLDVPVGEPATVRTVLGAAARLAPALVGTVLEADGTPIPPHYLLMDGRVAVGMDEAIRDADHPCLLVLASGG